MLTSAFRRVRRTAGRRTAAVVAVLLGTAVLAVPSASATSYGGAVAGPWPTTWTIYRYLDGTPIGDTNGDQSPPYLDLASGTCSSCVGDQPSVLLSNDGTNAYFRMRMTADNNDVSKGGLFGGAFLVQIADASGTVRAAVGVDGKNSAADYVYATNAVGGSTVKVFEYPFDGATSSAGMRWIPTGDGTGQYFLDFQVPTSVIATVSGGTVTPSTPVKLYYGSSAAANLATINKDLMIPGATAVDFTTLSVTRLVPTDTVSFDSDGGSAVGSESVAEGDPVAAPSAPTRAGFTFDGWYVGSSVWDFSDPVTGDLVLTAHWTRVAHSVGFDSDGGSAVGSQSVAEGDPVAAPSAPTRAGFTFDGWYVGSSVWDFSDPVTGDLVLTAHWTRVAHSVGFDSDGGSTVGSQSVAEGDPVAAPSAPTRAGFTFDGWYVGSSVWDFSDPVTGDLVLTAHWTRVAHSVGFDSDGGSTVGSQSVAEGDPVAAPSAPTRAGFTFDGWYVGSSVWDFSDPVTGDLVLTAHWTKITYVVSFDSDGADAIPPLVVDANGVAEQPADPVRTGYEFLGWYAGDSLWNFSDPITATTALSARWAPSTYPVTFDSDGGTAVGDQTVSYGSLAGEPADPTLTGYTFAGWYDGATPWDFGAPVSRAVTLVAHWTPTGGGGPVDGDSDSDGLTDATELALGTDPAVADTDGDGVADGDEVTGVRNGFGQCATDPLSVDSDDDSLGDGHEVTGVRVRGRLVLVDRLTHVGLVRTDPCRADTDGDGLRDGREVRGRKVRGAAVYRSNPLSVDTDDDGLGDRAEMTGSANVLWGSRPTDPMDWDTDDGGFSDGYEVQVGSNPTDKGSGPKRPGSQPGL